MVDHSIVCAYGASGDSPVNQTQTDLPQRLLTPGPTAVPPRVLEELAQPIIHHRTKQFRDIFSDLSQQLQQILGTQGPVLSIAGSGTTAFEAAQVCLARPTSQVITIASGKFGERWQDVYDRYAEALALEQVRINVPWGEPIPLAKVAQALCEYPRTSVVTVVHSETSTATVNDVRAIADLTRHSDALLIVDGITSVGALACEMDVWGIDCLVTGSQKAMMLPPGLGFVGLGEQALYRLDQIDYSLPAYNLDLRKWVASYQNADVPFTPPVPLVRAAKVSCNMILEQGLEAVWQQTRCRAEGTRAALRAMGLRLISSHPSDSLTGAYYPDGVDDSIRHRLRKKYGIHLAGGQDGRGGRWKGKIFRISHMGYVDIEDTRAALRALESELREAGAIGRQAQALPAFDDVAG